MNSSAILEQTFKDHTVENAVMDMSDLPLNARDVHMQPIRNIQVTIQVIKESDKSVIETITGKATDGSINLDSTSLIRRTGSLTLSVEPDLFPSPDSLMWFGNYLRVYVGIKDMANGGDYLNFLMGTYWIDEGDYSLDENSSTITIKISDKMTKYDDTQLSNPMIIPAETPISEAMRLLMEDVGETEFGHMMSDPTMLVPYDLEYGVGDNVSTILEALRDMYMECYCGYDNQGRFEFKKITVQKADEVAEPKWRFDSTANDRADLTLSFQEGYNLKAVRNHMLVYGGTSERTGMTPVGEIRLTDSKSPFNVDAIGSRKKVIVEGKYATSEQCISRARFEIWKSSNFQEKANIGSVPIYILDANDILEITHPETGVVSRYMLDSYSLGLGAEGNMSITAHKLYYVGLEYGEKMIPIVENFIKGINNYGWISLAEERIKDCFNIMGAGNNQLIVRFIEGVLGGEQASVTSYSTTKNQTLQIDIKDFEGLIENNESGDNGRSKGDYADRVIGHEMFHAVMNDYLGHDMAVQIPVFFKEGMAELLHGAKERFTSVHKEMSRTDKRLALENNVKNVLNGTWLGTSEDYVSAYLASVALYKLSNSLDWKNMIIRLKGQKNVSINFVQKLIPKAKTNEEAISMVLKQVSDMNTFWNFLFDEKDIDTGSIGGYHLMNLYGVRLDAESVFNNSSAVTDSIGFLIKFEK